MFGNSGNNPGAGGSTHTLVSSATEIIGDIHFHGELIIEGKVKGNIYADDESDAVVRVAEKGAVEGEICVPTAVINGLVQGDVRSSRHIELAAKATVVGNVYYNLIEMVMGSEINGNLMHIGNSQGEAGRLPAERQRLPFDSETLENN